MLHDLREIPVIDPFATLLALYEMLGLVFRGNAESGSKISREVTHGAIVPWAWAGDASLVRRIKSTRQAQVPPVCGSARPSSLPAQLGLGLPHLLRLISNFLFAGDASPVLLSASRILLGHHLPPVAVARRMCWRAIDSASKRRYPGRKEPRLNKAQRIDRISTGTDREHPTLAQPHLIAAERAIRSLVRATG
jgi:hypothetical protein